MSDYYAAQRTITAEGQPAPPPGVAWSSYGWDVPRPPAPNRWALLAICVTTASLLFWWAASLLFAFGMESGWGTTIDVAYSGHQAVLLAGLFAAGAAAYRSRVVITIAFAALGLAMIFASIGFVVGLIGMANLGWMGDVFWRGVAVFAILPLIAAGLIVAFVGAQRAQRRGRSRASIVGVGLIACGVIALETAAQVVPAFAMAPINVPTTTPLHWYLTPILVSGVLMAAQIAIGTPGRVARWIGVGLFALTTINIVWPQLTYGNVNTIFDAIRIVPHLSVVLPLLVIGMIAATALAVIAALRTPASEPKHAPNPPAEAVSQASA